MKQRKYADDYQVVKNLKGKTEYIYRGPLYKIKDAKQWDQFIVTGWITAALSTVLFLLMGFMNHDGSRQMYISIPFVFLLYPVAMQWVNVYKVTFNPKPMVRMTYIQGFLGTKNMALAAGIISLVALIGEAVYLIAGSSSTLHNEWLFCAFLLILCGINWLFYTVSRKIQVEEIH